MTEYDITVARYGQIATVTLSMTERNNTAIDHAIMHVDADQYLLTAAGEDAREGIAAFLEKRKPDFKGK